MKLRLGYELQCEFPQPTPVLATLNVHFTRVSGLETPDHIILNPSVPLSGYRDGFGNGCSRFVAHWSDVDLDRRDRAGFRIARSHRVQVIRDFTHRHITFGYEYARVTRTASTAYQERQEVCRDYTHLSSHNPTASIAVAAPSTFGSRWNDHVWLSARSFTFRSRRFWSIGYDQTSMASHTRQPSQLASPIPLAVAC